MFRWIFVLAAVLGFAGCSVHPRPEDTTGFNTVQIVAKVRCEVRDALRAFIIGSLRDPRRLEVFPQYAVLAEELQIGARDWRHLRDHLKFFRVDPNTMGVFEIYNGGTIAYEFLFNITENNKHAAGFDLLRTFTRGKLTAGLAGSSTLDRNNIRNFGIADNFEDLVTLFNEDYCGPGSENGTEPLHRRTANIVYPVTGSLGLHELVGAFLNLNQSGNLIGLPNAPAEVSRLPTISESMKFTTTFTGGGSLGWTGVDHGERAWRLSKATFATANTREDVHTLRMVLKLPLESEKRTRTVAEQRLAAAGVPIAKPASVRDLVKQSAIVDLTLAAEKEYMETKILVGRDARVLLPE
ncbi:MAG TPA: hypothetical protein VF744_19305 [Beijerinckiaceae bacterium]